MSSVKVLGDEESGRELSCPICSSCFLKSLEHVGYPTQLRGIMPMISSIKQLAVRIMPKNYRIGLRSAAAALYFTRFRHIRFTGIIFFCGRNIWRITSLK